MFQDLNLFCEPESKSECLTLRLTQTQKQRIMQMAKYRGMNASKMIMTFIAEEHQRQMSEAVFDSSFDTSDDGDGMPW